MTSEESQFLFYAAPTGVEHITLKTFEWNCGLRAGICCYVQHRTSSKVDDLSILLLMPRHSVHDFDHLCDYTK